MSLHDYDHVPDGYTETVRFGDVRAVLVERNRNVRDALDHVMQRNNVNVQRRAVVLSYLDEALDLVDAPTHP